MLYVGPNVHWRQSTFCILDGNGRHLRTRAIRGTWDKVLLRLAEMKRPFAVCFEATTGYGYLHEQLTRIAKRVVVAHPGQLRLIFRSRRKNDRGDAAKLAKLLFLDALARYPDAAHCSSSISSCTRAHDQYIAPPTRRMLGTETPRYQAELSY